MKKQHNKQDVGLMEIVETSSLDEQDRDVIISNFSDYEDVTADWAIKSKSIKVTDASQTAEMKMAREGRLFLREKRIAIEKTRKSMKEQSLRKGQAIDAIARYLTSLIKPIEDYLKEQEDFVKIMADKEAERIRLKEEAKAEKERLENERKQKVFQERRVEMARYSDYLERDDPVIDTETTDKGFREILAKLKDRKAKHEKEQKKTTKQNKKLLLAIEKKEDQLAEERERTEKAERKLQQQEEAEKEKIAEDQRAKKNERYKQWLEENGYDDSTMLVKRDGNVFKMYKLISEVRID